jgi:hypothetical protein
LKLNAAAEGVEVGIGVEGESDKVEEDESEELGDGFWAAAADEDSELSR